MPEFRSLNSKDIDEVMRVWNSLSEHYDHPIGGDWNAKKLYQEIQSKKSLAVFNNENRLEAFVFYVDMDDIKEITLLVTDLRQHRTGAMRSLIRSLISDLNVDEKIWLEVHAGNLPAIGLYESLGFKICGERLSYYNDGAKALLYEYNGSEG